MAKLLEVCVDSVESAVRAARGGATRLELCANLIIGGTSPDEDLFRMVRERVDIPVRVLLRPRLGDFLYTGDEFALLRRQVRQSVQPRMPAAPTFMISVAIPALSSSSATSLIAVKVTPF